MLYRSLCLCWFLFGFGDFGVVVQEVSSLLDAGFQSIAQCIGEALLAEVCVSEFWVDRQILGLSLSLIQKCVC